MYNYQYKLYKYSNYLKLQQCPQFLIFLNGNTSALLPLSVGGKLSSEQINKLSVLNEPLFRSNRLG